MAATAAPTLPAAPSALHSAGGSKASVPAADIAAMTTEMAAEQQLRDSVNPKATAANTSAMHAIHAFQCGEMEEAQQLLAAAQASVEAVLQEIDAGPRPWYIRGAPSVANCLERFGTAAFLGHFFAHGELAPRNTLPRLLDTEYLLAVMGFCQELSPYAIGRATAGDVGSVLVCSSLVGSAFAKLQEFDFRNGPLRRKFDGVKYVVRKCEDLLYELSLSGKYVPPPAGEQPPAKRARKDGDAPTATDTAEEYPRLVAGEFDTMREAVESADAQREAVIKRTRDVQKLSKQAIYSLHRWVCGDVAFVRADVPAAVVAAPCAVTALPGTTVRD
jgi:predicted translin family RNA/ssDNA-binding protein